MDPSGSSGSQSNTIVSRILKLALGLFVTTSELPHLTPEQAADLSFGYNCNFDQACRWSSLGHSANNWVHAKGEPEALIWLAATGTMAAPKQPFTLIELRGEKADSLTSDVIPCQNDNGLLSFTYWTIGKGDLEICLLDEYRQKFNCTGMLQSHIQPKTVSLNIPAISHPFYISLIPNQESGVIILDDIEYHARLCQIPKNKPDFVLPWKPPTPPPLIPVDPVTLFPPFTETPITPFPTLAPFQPITVVPIFEITTTESVATPAPISTFPTVPPPVATKTEPPFELLIIGNRTRPLFDNRKGKVIDDVNQLLCDFGSEFACLWGAEAGRWAVIEEGAIPTLETGSTAPTYPSALIIQGTAMFTSDPIRCQSGQGSLFFRYWTNGKVLLQACVLGYHEESTRYQCSEEVGEFNLKTGTLAIFNFNESIPEPFTLNIVPMWEKEAKNQYLIIDEVAYIGNCSSTDNNAAVIVSTTEVSQTTHQTARPPIRLITPFAPQTTTMKSRVLTTQSTFKPTSPRYEFSTTTEAPIDYCTVLNCDFNDSACNYLNHGLTRVPWTLRSKGYGFPLSRATDIRPTTNNGQFVSTLLAPGDFAILESPVFNVTQGVNVLLFQYYRPTHATTIRLCLGTTSTKPLRTVASFTQCPPILRSLTAKTAYKWNGVHISIPPGTTHFYLVAHNLDKSSEKSAIAIDNIRVAICDPRTFDTDASDPIYQDQDE